MSFPENFHLNTDHTAQQTTHVVPGRTRRGDLALSYTRKQPVHELAELFSADKKPWEFLDFSKNMISICEKRKFYMKIRLLQNHPEISGKLLERGDSAEAPSN